MFLVDICLLVFIHWEAGSSALLTTKVKLIAVNKKNNVKQSNPAIQNRLHAKEHFRSQS